MKAEHVIARLRELHMHEVADELSAALEEGGLGGFKGRVRDILAEMGFNKRGIEELERWYRG